MGWASGSRVMAGIINASVNAGLTDAQRTILYADIIKVLEDSDWDTQYKCLGMDSSYEVALQQIHPEYFSDESD